MALCNLQNTGNWLAERQAWRFDRQLKVKTWKSNSIRLAPFESRQLLITCKFFKIEGILEIQMIQYHGDDRPRRQKSQTLDSKNSSKIGKSLAIQSEAISYECAIDVPAI